MHRPDLPADQRLGIAEGCVCGKCKAEWLGWTCPRSQARLDQESRFICDDERPGAGYDTWTTRSSLFGTFGVHFELYVDDELISNPRAGFCEDCGLSFQAVDLACGEFRVCWSCYAVILIQLGNWLHANIFEAYMIVLDFLGSTVAIDMQMLRSIRDYYYV